MTLLKLLLVIAVVVAVWYVVRAVRAQGGTETSFTPVEELAPDVRGVIDAALARGQEVAAVKHYRAATGAGLVQSRTAVETYRWKQGGPAS